jgi:hypothetical protein
MTEQTLRYQLIDEGKALMQEMGRLVGELIILRDKETVASKELSGAEEGFGKINNERLQHYAVFPEITEQPDPRTGKVNKDWSNLLMSQALEQDPDWIVARAEVFAKKEVVERMQTDMVNLIDALNVTKTSARLVSAMLESLSNVPD